ncbi:hypothetical protein ACERII_00145 [Evansella sp. AB-rgal1]|uniref:hypothetical protein n=1 Tax=Evansella sp. AB-rgal1 TaxID=3242696 RepID=UPI00359D00A1
MLALNEGMHYIRCSRYEYLVKRGSISNYSFSIKDEEKTGILDAMFEIINYPIELKDLEEQLASLSVAPNSDQMKSLIHQLLEIEVLYEISKKTKQDTSLCVIVDDHDQSQIVTSTLKNEQYYVTYYSIDNKSSSSLPYIDLENEKDTKEVLKNFDYILLFKRNFSPNTFHKFNKLCLDLNSKLIISYLDGNEGIIIPLVNCDQVGCYNDFEIMRESSFYNLLDYQVMKEQLLLDENGEIYVNPIHFTILVNQTCLLLEQFISYTNMNYFAYSFDFERMVNTKSRLLKFPKCPSCQGDKNLVHAFI